LLRIHPKPNRNRNEITACTGNCCSSAPLWGLGFKNVIKKQQRKAGNMEKSAKKIL
jgi:hypothetical protein